MESAGQQALPSEKHLSFFRSLTDSSGTGKDSYHFVWINKKLTSQSPKRYLQEITWLRLQMCEKLTAFPRKISEVHKKGHSMHNCVERPWDAKS